MLQMIQTAINKNEDVQEENTEENVNTMNATIQDNVQVEMLKLLRDLRNNMSTNSPSNNGGRDGANRCCPQKTPDIANFHRRITNNYAHTSTECTCKASGHKDDATLANRQGGSNAFCTAAK